jgi:5-methylcytosine-specific restriction endonuclease McrA
MASSPNYVRDMKQERATQLARGEGEDNRKRKQARRDAVKKGMVKPNDGKDVDHKKPLSKGGSNDTSNLRARSPSANRSFPRTSSGAIKKP